MQIEEKPPFDTPFEWLGGEPRVKLLVDRFYDLMDLEPSYLELRATHGPDLTNARERLFMFLCGWLGGPNYYVENTAIHVCVCATCLLQLASKNVTNGWRAWTKPWARPMCLKVCVRV